MDSIDTIDRMNLVLEMLDTQNSVGKKRTHIFLAKLALESWEKQLSSGNVPLTYQDTVEGTLKNADISLPADAIEAVISQNPSDISERYRGTVFAIHFHEWELNDDATAAYCAIYNTYGKYIEGKEVEDYHIVNQALASLGKGADIFVPLVNALSSSMNEKLEVPPNKLLQRIKKIFTF